MHIRNYSTGILATQVKAHSKAKRKGTVFKQFKAIIYVMVKIIVIS
jgi:hypothetical protein